MGGHLESTSFLADNDHDDSFEREESHPTKTSPANSYFKRPIKNLTALISFLCLSVLGLLIATFVVIQNGQFQYPYNSSDKVRDLAIGLFVNFILSAPTLFLEIPIIINIGVHIAMSIVILVFSGEIFGSGWPDWHFCRRRSNTSGDFYPSLPDLYECTDLRSTVRTMMGVSAYMGILIGLLILTVLLLRLIAVARTRFWEGRRWGIPVRNPTGFTVQLTLSVFLRGSSTPEDGKPTAAVSSSYDEKERLIET